MDDAVLYITRFVPSYRLPVLERLNERVDGRLVVCSGDPPPGSSFASLGTGAQGGSFGRVRLQNRWMGGERLHWQSPGPAFAAHPSPAAVLVEESPRSASLPRVLRRARSAGAGSVLWGHFSSNRRVFDPERHTLDRIRVAMARRADACVCYTDDMAGRLSPILGAERVFVARNTLDTDRLQLLHDALAARGRPAVRAELGMPEHGPVLVYIGRLIEEKGIPLLLDTYERLLADGPATLVIIGDGPERATIDARVAAEGWTGVICTGPLPDLDASAPWLHASDLLLSPGYLGLSVNHAFAFGLPVVSIAARPGERLHSPEADYLQDGLNGLLAERSPDAVAAAVRSVIDRRDAFSAEALAYAREHLTIDSMVDGLEASLRFAARLHGREIPR